MRKIMIMIAAVASLCVLGLSFTGCGGRYEEREDGGVTVDVTADVVRQNINDLANADWDKANYHAILDSQISMLGDEDTKESLTKMLKNAYAKVLVTEGSRLMDSNGCGPNHSRLNSVMSELKSDAEFKKADGASGLLARYETHSAAISFEKTISTKASASSWQSNYDPSYENNIKAQAQSHIAKNPNCSYIKNILSESALKKKFKLRRQSFCYSLVEKFRREGPKTDYESAKRMVSKIEKFMMGPCPNDMRTDIMRDAKLPEL